MKELSRSQFHRVRTIVEELNIHLAVGALLEGAVPGAVYVDDPQGPRAVLVWTGHRVYLAGTTEVPRICEELNKLFASTIHPDLRRAGMSAFVLYYAPDSWQTKAEESLAPLPTVRAVRQAYSCLKPRLDWRSRLPDGYSLRAVNSALLAETRLQHLDALREEMCSEHPSIEAFLAQSFGVCAIHSGALAGWCLSEYNLAERCEVGIEILEGHRQKGLGSAMTEALVAGAFEQGISRVGWHCWRDNEASVATARRAGFEHVADYPALFVRLD